MHTELLCKGAAKLQAYQPWMVDLAVQGKACDSQCSSRSSVQSQVISEEVADSGHIQGIWHHVEDKVQFHCRMASSTMSVTFRLCLCFLLKGRFTPQVIDT